MGSDLAHYAIRDFVGRGFGRAPERLDHAKRGAGAVGLEHQRLVCHEVVVCGGEQLLTGTYRDPVINESDPSCGTVREREVLGLYSQIAGGGGASHRVQARPVVVEVKRRVRIQGAPMPFDSLGDGPGMRGDHQACQMDVLRVEHELGPKGLPVVGRAADRPARRLSRKLRR